MWLIDFLFGTKVETHDLKCKECGWTGYKNQAESCYWDFEFANYFCGNKNCRKPIEIDNIC